MVTLEPTFAKLRAAQVHHQTSFKDLIALPTLLKDTIPESCPDMWAYIIHECCANIPSDRPNSMIDIAHMLVAFFTAVAGDDDSSLPLKLRQDFEYVTKETSMPTELLDGLRLYQPSWMTTNPKIAYRSICLMMTFELFFILIEIGRGVAKTTGELCSR